VRTLFEQLWVLGDQIVAVKPAAQFTPFFRLVQSTVSQAEGDGEKGEGDKRDEGLQLLFVESAVAAETETVGAIAEKIARDAVRHGREEARVRRGGPDGVGVRSAGNVNTDARVCFAAEKFGVSINHRMCSRHVGRWPWYCLGSSQHGTTGPTAATPKTSWTTAAHTATPQ
jgi:hypothetical protein